MEGPGLALTLKSPALVTLGTAAASTLEKFTPVYRRTPDCTRRSAACLALAGLSPSSSTTKSTGVPPSFSPPALLDGKQKAVAQILANVARWRRQGGDKANLDRLCSSGGASENACHGRQIQFIEHGKSSRLETTRRRTIASAQSSECEACERPSRHGPPMTTGKRPGCASAVPMPVARPRPIDWNACVKAKLFSSGTRRYMLG